MRKLFGALTLSTALALIFVAITLVPRTTETKMVPVSYSYDPPEPVAAKSEPAPQAPAAAPPRPARPQGPPPPVTPVSVPTYSTALMAAGLRVPVYASPSESAQQIYLPAKNELGQQQGFLSLQKQGDWHYAMLPNYPTASKGWIPASAVEEKQVIDYIVVRIGQRRLEHYQDGVLKQSFSVAVGKASTPTPIGKFYVMGYARDTLAHYKPIDIGLSAFSPVLKAKGRTGIHGWHDPSVAGRAVSNGCIRMRKPDAAKLAPYIQVGMPVEVVN